MSEKVLGFYEKDAEITNYGKNVKAKWLVELRKCFRAMPSKQPVRLASESVDLKALKEWCERNKFGYAPPRINKDELMKWAEKEAKKNE